MIIDRRFHGPDGSGNGGYTAGLLVGLSLLASALFHEEDRGGVYVPAEVEPGGHMIPGHFEQKAPGK